jgi:threonine synthase
MRKAYDELCRLGLVDDPLPRFAAVQMAGCAPIVRAFDSGAESASTWADPRTRVWGLRVPSAIADFLVLRALRESRGAAIAIEEAAIAGATARAAREEGLLVGPEGAAALLAVERLARDGTIAAGDRVVVFQTGHPASYV